MAQRSSPAKLVERLYRQAVRWYRWTTFYASKWDAVHGGGAQREDAEDAEDPPDPEPPPGAAHLDRGHERKRDARRDAPLHLRPARLHRLSPHELWADHRRTVCKSCGRQTTAKTATARNRFTSTRCLGAAAARALVRLGLRGAALSEQGRVGRQALLDMGLAPLRSESHHSGRVSPVPGPTDGDQPARGSAIEARQAHGDESQLAEPGRKRSRSPSAESAGRRTRPRISPEPEQRAHRMQVVGPIAFCELCGRYAIERHGVGLQEHCPGRDPNVLLRIQRMRRGQHPLTGEDLTCS